MRKMTPLAVGLVLGLLGFLLLNAMVGAAPPEPRPPAKAPPVAAPPVNLPLAPMPPTASPAPAVYWTPAIISSTQSLSPGQSFGTTVSFTVTRAITNVNVVAMPDTQQIAVSPAHFDSLSPGLSYSVVVTITAPAAGNHLGFTAQVALRAGRNVIRQPLRVIWRPAPPPLAEITWSPSHITATQALKPGELVTQTVSFSADRALTNVSVVVSQMSRGGRISASPVHFDRIDPNTSHDIVVTVRAAGGPGLEGASAQIGLRVGRQLLPGRLSVVWRPPAQPAPHITWSSRVITETAPLLAGQSLTVPVTFTSTAPIENAVAMVSDLTGSGQVTAVPRHFASIVPGQTYTMSVVIKAGARPTGVAATIMLCAGTRLIPDPLRVVWRPTANAGRR